MKTFNLSKAVKLCIVITLSVLIVGLALFGVFGLNKTSDYKLTKEIRVQVLDFDKSVEITEETCNDFFEEKKVSYVKLTKSELSTDSVLTFSFDGDEGFSFSESELREAITDSLDSIGSVPTEVSFNVSKVAWFNQTFKIVLALAIAILAIFVYLFFIEKLASALATIISGILSALLFIAMMGLTRIPAEPFVETVEALTVLLTVILSAGLVTRFKELSNNVANEKLSGVEITTKAIKTSVPRFIVMFASCLVVALFMFIVGPYYFKYLALQIIVSSITALFTSIVWTPFLWALLKKNNKPPKHEDISKE